MIYYKFIDEIRLGGTRKRTLDKYGWLIDPDDPSILQKTEFAADFQKKWALMVEESQKLPTAERRVFECVCLERMTIEDYARKYGIKPQTVRNQKNNALKKIRKNLKKRNLDISLIIMLFLH